MLLWRYTGRKDFVISSPPGGITSHGAESCVRERLFVEHERQSNEKTYTIAWNLQPL